MRQRSIARLKMTLEAFAHGPGLAPRGIGSGTLAKLQDEGLITRDGPTTSGGVHYVLTERGRQVYEGMVNGAELAAHSHIDSA